MNKLVDQYDNIYHCSIGKKLVDSDYSGLTEEIKSSHKVAKFTVGDKVRITNYKKFFNKSYTECWSRKIFVIDSVLKTSPWTYKTKSLNGVKLIVSFYWKELLLSYYAEPDNPIRDKVKAVLDLTNDAI